MHEYITDVDCSAVASRRPGVIRLHDGLLDARAPSLAGLEGFQVIVWVRCKTAKLATIDHADLII
jgi:hypothetical protein